MGVAPEGKNRPNKNTATVNRAILAGIDNFAPVKRAANVRVAVQDCSLAWAVGSTFDNCERGFHGCITLHPPRPWIQAAPPVPLERLVNAAKIVVKGTGQRRGRGSQVSAGIRSWVPLKVSVGWQFRDYRPIHEYLRRECSRSKYDLAERRLTCRKASAPHNHRNGLGGTS